MLNLMYVNYTLIKLILKSVANYEEKSHFKTGKQKLKNTHKAVFIKYKLAEDNRQNANIFR